MSVRLAVILYRNEQGIVVPPQVLATDNNGSTYVMFRATAGATPANVPAVPGQAITQGVEVQGLQAARVRDQLTKLKDRAFGAPGSDPITA